MTILKLLSEEIFDFSKDQLTEQKTKTLKESLNHEFTQIFQVCAVRDATVVADAAKLTRVAMM
jgi:hypothetical protein